MTLERRLRALEEYQILDTEAERSFDDIVFLTQKICQTPAALISLVADDRQWFKARIGFEACEVPISQSVCRHGMASRELLVVPDLTLDARTCDNPLVVGEPNIRFYAGAPLVTPDGTIIGMLCVIDTAPRPDGLDPDQHRSLKALAGQVITQLEMRKTMRDHEIALEVEREEAAILRRTTAQLQMAEEVGEIGAFEIDFTSREIVMSREFCRIHGLEPQKSLRLDELDRRVPGSALIGAALNDATDFERGEFRITRESDGHDRWLDIRSRYRLDDEGNRIGVAGIVTDVTEQRAVNEEISHRLKNTMALVQAIAGHTLRGIADPAPVHEFNRRVSALATAHDILLRRTSSAACLHEVAEGVLAGLSIEDRVKRDGKDIELTSRAVLVLSMLLHELGTNAMKYGALSTPAGQVSLTTSLEPGDDGDRLIIDWVETGGPEPRTPERLGLGTRLIQRGLAPDGDAELSYEPAGFKARIMAPINQVGA
ncbi:HWE histidine kinase domain-containing protein [Croceicoccus ponticola]|nr:HWE histidine kinase domain-containing protein [Croceicoccus ponticola]